MPEYKGSICQVTFHIPQVRYKHVSPFFLVYDISKKAIFNINIFQTFRKVDCSKYSELADVKFKFFIEEVH